MRWDRIIQWRQRRVQSIHFILITSNCELTSMMATYVHYEDCAIHYIYHVDLNTHSNPHPENVPLAISALLS